MGQFLEITPLSEAKNLIQKNIKDRQIKEVALVDSLSQICGQNIFSPIDLPLFNRSTVDGYAVVAESIFGASDSVPSLLSFLGSVSMGKENLFSIEKNQCMYVPTGGMIPKGTTAMVMIEDTERLGKEIVMVYKPSKYGENIVFCGDDVKKGSLLIPIGKKITPYDIGMLAGVGITQVPVFIPLKFTVISTGDEIVSIEAEPTIGQIRDINGYAIKAWLKTQGADIVADYMVKDDFIILKDAIKRALKISDGIILSGGASKGVRDYTRKVIESFNNGKILLHGLAIKPGKPTILGKINKTLIFGLPGHPVSALIVCRQLVGTFINTMDQRQITEIALTAKLTHHLRGEAPGRDSFQLVKLKKKDEEWLAEPLFGSSGMISLLSKAAGYVIVPREVEGFLEGRLVKVYRLQEVSIEN